MGYDEQLADRLREAIEGEPGLSEKRMFGGLAFLVHGNMAVAASGQGGLMVRVDPTEAEALTAHPGVDRMEMRGRAMDGWLRIDAGVVAGDEPLRRWIDVGLAAARAMPPK
jgi:TfoX/Sxy family transcriptional regulator of competence genes